MSGDADLRRTSELHRYGMALVCLFLIQFLLGTWLNLFISIPQHHPGTTGPDYFLRAGQSLYWGLSHGNVLAAHAGLGLPIFLISLRLGLFSWHRPQRELRWISLLGLLAVLAAGFNGASFLSHHQDLSSMISATSFAVAVFCFSWVVFRAAARPEPQGRWA